jgi:hypothetical protein
MTPRLGRNLRTHQALTVRAPKVRFVVVRWDGVELGGATTLEAAERLADSVSQGQERDFARVVKRSGE